MSTHMEVDDLELHGQKKEVNQKFHFHPKGDGYVHHIHFWQDRVNG